MAKRRFNLINRLASSLKYAFRASEGYPAAPYSGGPMWDASKSPGGLEGYRAPGWINRAHIVSQSRRAMLDSPELIALGRTLRVLVIGDGIKISSAPERDFLPELENKSEEEIKSYRKKIDTLWDITAESTSFDMQGERSLAALMHDCFARFIQDGEVFISFYIEQDPEKAARTLTPLRMQMILPEDVTDPDNNNSENIKEGIEFNKQGVPVAYYINNVKISKHGANSGRIQISHFKNGSTLRGLPPFMPAIEIAKHLENYQLSELIKQKMSSSIFMGATGTMDSALKASSRTMIEGKGKNKDENKPPSFRDDAVEVRPGTYIVRTTSDNTLSKIDTPTPSATFPQFIRSIQNRINMMSGLSTDIVTKDVSTSYSAARFQSQLAELDIAAYRQPFIDAVLRPLFENWFMIAHEQGHFPFIENFETQLHKKSWMAIEFSGRPLPDLSPLQEANAFSVYLRDGIISRAEIAKKLGLPKWEDTVNTLIQEQKIIDEMAAQKMKTEGEMQDEQQY